MCMQLYKSVGPSVHLLVRPSVPLLLFFALQNDALIFLDRKKHMKKIQVFHRFRTVFWPETFIVSPKESLRVLYKSISHVYSLGH